jgi:hypothetical protein
MSRFDKYDPVSGGFRAPLLAAIVSADKDKIQAVSINTSGQVVIGGPAETAVMGLICPGRAMAAGDIVDVMTHGEIVEATMTSGTALTAGAIVYAHAAGTVDATATAGKIVAKMVELDRMIVRVPVATT